MNRYLSTGASRLPTLILLTVAAWPVQAQVTATSGPALLRVGLGLVFVLALIYACAWTARRFGVARHMTGASPMKVVGTLALSPRERILTLEVDGTWLVVGITPGGMRTLHTLPAKPLRDPPQASFLSGLERALHKRKRHLPAEDRPDPHGS